MYERIYLTIPRVKAIFENEPPNVFAWFLGRNIEGISMEEMRAIWEISGQMINGMYTQVIKTRRGVG